MSLTNPFQFLIDYYFFDDRYYCTKDSFICTSCITGQIFRIQKTDDNGYTVDLKVIRNGKIRWETQMAVANIQSSLGVVADLEDEWLKHRKKNQKDTRINAIR